MVRRRPVHRSYQSHHKRKIAVKKLTMKSKSEKAISSLLPSNSSGNSSRLLGSGALESTAQAGDSNGFDWKEEVYQKIQTMKEMYLPELTEMYPKIALKLQRHDPVSHPLEPEKLQKLEMFKAMLDRMIAFLQVSKDNITPAWKEKLTSYEKQIMSFVNSNRPTKQQLQLGHPHTQQSQFQASKMQSHENQMNAQQQASSALEYTAQAGHSNEFDWKEEVYQKIQTMKEMYLPELTEMYQKIALMLQRHDPVSHPLESEKLQKLKMFKAMLERMTAFLQVSKHNIMPVFKEKFSSYEKQIMNVINSNRKANQQLQPGRPHIQQPQSQVSKVQFHDIQMNAQQETSSASAKSTAQTGHSIAGDWQVEVYQEIQTMEMYLAELNEISQKIASKLRLEK